MNRTFKVRNNRKTYGSCNVVLEHFVKLLSSYENAIQVDTSDERIYYRVKDGETLLGIVSGYMTDPDKVEEIIKTIQNENKIREVKAGDIILLHGAPSNYHQDEALKDMILEVEDRFHFILNYLQTVDEFNRVKYAIVVSFMKDFISSGVYRNEENLMNCLEKCREMSDEIIESSRQVVAVK